MASVYIFRLSDYFFLPFTIVRHSNIKIYFTFSLLMTNSLFVTFLLYHFNTIKLGDEIRANQSINQRIAIYSLKCGSKKRNIQH